MHNFFHNKVFIPVVGSLLLFEIIDVIFGQVVVLTVFQYLLLYLVFFFFVRNVFQFVQFWQVHFVDSIKSLQSVLDIQEFLEGLSSICSLEFKKILCFLCVNVFLQALLFHLVQLLLHHVAVSNLNLFVQFLHRECFFVLSFNPELVQLTVSSIVQIDFPEYLRPQLFLVGTIVSKSLL